MLQSRIEIRHIKLIHNILIQHLKEMSERRATAFKELLWPVHRGHLQILPNYCKLYKQSSCNKNHTTKTNRMVQLEHAHVRRWAFYFILFTFNCHTDAWNSFFPIDISIPVTWQDKHSCTQIHYPASFYKTRTFSHGTSQYQIHITNIVYNKNNAKLQSKVLQWYIWRYDSKGTLWN